MGKFFSLFCGIFELFLRPGGNKVTIPGTAGPPLLHTEVFIIAALGSGAAGHGAAALGGPGENRPQEGDGLAAGQLIPVIEEVKACLAAHRPEVDHRVPALGIAQEGGNEMLHGVHLAV